MDVRLPNGKIIKGVPEGTPKDVIMQKAIAAGLATPEDFNLASQKPEAPQAEPLPVIHNDVPTDEWEQDQPKKGGRWDEFAEPVKAMAGGIAGSVAGGYEAIGKLLSGGDLDQSVETLKKTQEILSNMPETEAGKRGLQVVTGALENIEAMGNYFASGFAGLSHLALNPMDGIQGAQQEVERVRANGLSAYLGNSTLEQTGSPLAATTASMLPSIAEIALGSKGAQRGLHAINNRRPAITGSNSKAIIDKLRTDPTHKTTAGYDLVNPNQPKSTAMVHRGGMVERMVDAGDSVDNTMKQLATDPAGTIRKGVNNAEDFIRNAAREKERLVKNPLEQEAVKQGWGSDMVSLLKTSTPATKKKTLEMLNMMEKIKNNAKYGGRNRPNDIIGQSIQDRLNVILRANRTAGQKIDSISKSLKSVDADFDTPVNDFMSQLDDMGLNLQKELSSGTLNGLDTPKAVWKRIFKGSDIEGVKGAERVMKNIIARMADTDVPNAYDMHRLKKYIDEQVSWGKTSEGLTGRAEIALKQLRGGINQQLQNASPAYARVNKVYSETINVLDQLQSSVSGKKIDFQSVAATRKLGNETRKIQSNYNSFADLLDSLDAIDATAKKYASKPSFSTGLSVNATPGTKLNAPDFTDNLVELAQLSEELNRRFGTTQKTSLEGAMAKGVNQGLQSFAEGAEVTIAKAVAKGYDKAKGVTDENAYKAMRELLEKN